MQVYSGPIRRQVGGGLWSTIRRGIQPLIAKLKPLASKAGRHLAQRAVSSAMNVGSKVAMGGDIKSALKDEGKNIKSEALEKLRGFKRKYLPDEQEGKGHKRRRLNKKVAKKVNKKMGKRKVSKRKSKPRKAYKRSKCSGKAKKALKRAYPVKRRKSRGKKSFNDIFGK